MCEGEGRAVVRERTRRLFLPWGGLVGFFRVRIRSSFVAGLLALCLVRAGARRVDGRSSWF